MRANAGLYAHLLVRWRWTYCVIYANTSFDARTEKALWLKNEGCGGSAACDVQDERSAAISEIKT